MCLYVTLICLCFLHYMQNQQPIINVCFWSPASNMMNCPSSGPQGNCIWPCQTTQQPGAPMWPSQPYQPCWPYQPNQANWPGMQPTVPTWPAYQPAPPNQPGWPSPLPTGPSQPNQPILPSQPIPPSQPVSPSQPISPSQPMPPSQPTQPVPTSQPVLPSQPSQVIPPGQAIPPTWPSQLPNPNPTSWHGNPGQPGWPNQSPIGVQQHSWPPIPPSGPVVSHFNIGVQFSVKQSVTHSFIYFTYIYARLTIVKISNCQLIKCRLRMLLNRMQH